MYQQEKVKVTMNPSYFCVATAWFKAGGNNTGKPGQQLSLPYVFLPPNSAKVVSSMGISEVYYTEYISVLYAKLNLLEPVEAVFSQGWRCKLNYL